MNTGEPYPGREVSQVMSAQSTQSGAGGSRGLAGGYGGVDAGGAHGPGPDGGEARNRAMAEGRGLLNGVAAGGPFEDSQLPHVPTSRPGPTGSQQDEQRDVRRVERPSSSTKPPVETGRGVVAMSAAELDRGATEGSQANVGTGPGANSESGPGAIG